MAEAVKKAWKDVTEEKLNDMATRKFIHGEKVMASELRFKKGASVPEHSHESEQMSWVIEGKLLMVVEGKEIVVSSGEVLVIPSYARHSATALEDTVDIDLFSPIRDDWISGDDSYLRKS